MMRRIPIVFGLLVLMMLAGATQAAAPCVNISYPDVGPISKGTTGSVLPSVTLSGCGEIDDPRTYSKASGPSWVTVSSFNGRASYDTTGVTVGTYTVTVSVSWGCSCGPSGDADTFTITVC